MENKETKRDELQNAYELGLIEAVSSFRFSSSVTKVVFSFKKTHKKFGVCTIWCNDNRRILMKIKIKKKFRGFGLSKEIIKYLIYSYNINKAYVKIYNCRAINTLINCDFQISGTAAHNMYIMERKN